jgi:hypothetical protein
MFQRRNRWRPYVHSVGAGISSASTLDPGGTPGGPSATSWNARTVRSGSGPKAKKRYQPCFRTARRRSCTRAGVIRKSSKSRSPAPADSPGGDGPNSIIFVPCARTDAMSPARAYSAAKEPRSRLPCAGTAAPRARMDDAAGFGVGIPESSLTRAPEGGLRPSPALQDLGDSFI